MPSTSKKLSPDLHIVLEGGQRAYAPGETVIGRVERRYPVTCPLAIVTVSLYGRATTIAPGTKSDDLGQLKLIDGDLNTHEVFQGPLHIPKRESQEWPFVIEIPTHIDPRSLPRQATGDEEWTFLPLPRDQGILGTLPPSFEGSSYLSYAHVEYWVQATLNLLGQAHSGRATALLPILVSPLHLGPPITDMGLQFASKLHHVNSFHLSPARPNNPLSTSDKFKRIFKPRTPVPFTFDMEVGFPSRIQLDNPNPIPFQLRAIPKETESDSDTRRMPETLKLKTVDLIVATHVHTRNKDGSESWTLKTNLQTERATSSQYNQYEIPIAKDQPPLDIGREINLKVKLEPADDSYKTYLRPMFETYNIRISHSLRWSVRYEIAGKVLEAEASQAIQVLPPSGDGQENPAAPPPSYETSQSMTRPPHYDGSDSGITREDIKVVK
ncbi:unnamed protein product [Clonostachys rosea]|uniref:Arrestin-like N-terminal domain-containing protein n=1 Tax=Bionectria ochroleuca TaxID=29856 RepID=A0ABY6UYS7_BIOOC|nr:unnamed protein product [Clonostachys rosea]